jgi:ABC-2 type transport system permease protein
MALFGHLFRGQLVNALIWGGVLGLMGGMYVSLFPSMGTELDQYIESMPEAMKAFVPSLGLTGTVEAWLNMELFSLLAPLALPFFVIIMGARAIAGREERGKMDLLLSNPLPRWMLVLATFLAMLAALLVALVPIYLLTLAVAPLVNVDLDPVALLEGTVNLLPMCLSFGALALLLSTLVHRAARAIVVPAALLVGMYVLEGLGNYSAKVEPLQPVGVFHHYGAAIVEGIDWPRFLGLLLVALVLMAMSIVAFSRREIFT